MSTRSNIIVDDGYRRIQLYRHYDGFPDDLLPDLEQALLYAWPWPRFEAADFAAAIVRAWKGEGGGNITVDGSPKDWELIHADVEWVYLIRPQGEKMKEGVQPFYAGDPIVEVYDWRDFWFSGVDPHKVKPQPIKRVKLLEAKMAGRKDGGL
jgi:hypothetical protein